jgi:hypothetical protein
MTKRKKTLPMPYSMPMDHCLKCGTLFDEATRAAGGAGRPKPGDFTLCLHCGHIMAFDKDRRVRQLNSFEILTAVSDIRILKIEEIRQQVMKEYKDKKKS